MGYEIGKNLKRQNVKLDYKAFNKAIVDVMEDKQESLDNEQRREIMTKISKKQREERKKAAEMNQTKGEEFLAANKEKEGVNVTDSGLQYKAINEGTGAKPKASDIVEVHYKGTLIDGTEFDSSYKRNKPAEFPLRNVIPGWTEGLQLMTVGSKYMFFIPPKLAYGPRGNTTIPGNSTLIFEVELLSIKEKKEEPKTKKK